jgi:hypothetical protein
VIDTKRLLDKPLVTDPDSIEDKKLHAMNEGSVGIKVGSQEINIMINLSLPKEFTET